MPTTSPPTTRLLDRETAASFLGVSERSFDSLVLMHDELQPLRFGRRCLWDRKKLDDWVDQQSGYAPKPDVDEIQW